MPRKWLFPRLPTPHLYVASERSPAGGPTHFCEVPMLRSLFPRSHRKFLSLPLLGPVVEGFDQWLVTNAYTREIGRARVGKEGSSRGCEKHCREIGRERGV